MEGQTTTYIQLSREELDEVIERTVKAALSGKNDELISRNEAMELLGIKTVLTMIRWERKGYLKPRRIGGRVLYQRGEVLKAAEEFSR